MAGSEGMGGHGHSHSIGGGVGGGGRAADLSGHGHSHGVPLATSRLAKNDSLSGGDVNAVDDKEFIFNPYDKDDSGMEVNAADRKLQKEDIHYELHDHVDHDGHDHDDDHDDHNHHDEHDGHHDHHDGDHAHEHSHSHDHDDYEHGEDKNDVTVQLQKHDNVPFHGGGDTNNNNSIAVNLTNVGDHRDNDHQFSSDPAHNISRPDNHDHDHEHDHDHDRDHGHNTDHIETGAKSGVPINLDDEPAASAKTDLNGQPDESILLNFEAVPTVSLEGNVFFDDDSEDEKPRQN